MKKVMNLETPGSRLRSIRAYCAPSRNSFCELVKLSESTLKAWENDVAALTVKGANSLAKKFQMLGVYCTAEWLLEGKDPSPLKNIDTYSSQDISEEKFIQDEFKRLESYYQKQFVLHQVQDQSMAPFFKMGDYVGGTPIHKNEVPYFWDDVVLIDLEKKGLSLRTIHKGSQPGLITLTSLNLPAHHAAHTTEDIEANKVLRIVWHCSSLQFNLKKTPAPYLKSSG